MGAIEAWVKEKLELWGERLTGAGWGALVVLGLVALYVAWKAGTPWFLATIIAAMALLASGGRG
jgi:CHASE2 domain-containing sensor protein